MSRHRASKIINDAYDVLRRPVLTEKTHDLLPMHQKTGEEHRARYTFDVHPKATKDQIKRAVEDAFGVKVASVNTMIVKPRQRSFRMARGAGGTGFTREKKKAVIRLTKDSKTIDLI
ncbi:MAG: 50S ribosomal protein L23 [Planctomycetota bacterium]|nr:50S ribosomal protein L23 [Planctomycetota bacterium]